MGTSDSSNSSNSSITKDQVACNDSDSAGVAVLSDSALVDRVAEFQRGYPQEIADLARSATEEQLLHSRGVRLNGRWTQLEGALPRLAAVKGDPRTLRFLYNLKSKLQYQNDPLLKFTNVMGLAAKLQRLDMLECLLELKNRDPTWQWDDYLMNLAIADGDCDTRVLEWLYAHLPPEKRELQPYHLLTAITRCNVGAVRWLVEHGCRALLHAMSDAMTAAASSGSLEVLAYMYQHTDARCRTYAIERAAANGHLAVVKFLAPGRSRDSCEWVVASAARHGQLEVMQYFVEQDIAVIPKDVIEQVACEGHLGVIQYLLEHIPGGCTPRAMDLAATCGHLDIVKFLHENRTEGCTRAAMNGAAAHGHLDVVKFLHERRTEGCTTKAMNGAAAHGHLDVVKFLHENRTEGCKPLALRRAVLHQHLDVVEFLRENRPECDIGAVMIGAASGGNMAMVEFLNKYPEAQAVAYAALKAAADNQRRRIVEFLCENQLQQERRESPRFLMQAVVEGAKWLVDAVLPYTSRAEVAEATAMTLDRETEPQMLHALGNRLQELA